MASDFFRLLWLTCVILACARSAESQDTRDAEVASQPDSAKTPQNLRLAASSKLQNGLNASVTIAGVHDSSVGWYNVVTPVLSYTFAEHFSSDLSMSIYPYRFTRTNNSTPPATRLAFTGGDLGDMLLEAHATFSPRSIRSTFTVAMALPTGNASDGLGTGRVTFNVDNRLEHYFGQTGIMFDIGGGDSSGLANRLVTQDDSSLGALVQFQAGGVTWFPHSISLQSTAYEQLPLGDQKTYATVNAPGFTTIKIVSGRKVYEDNGFTTILNVPLSQRISLTGSYNRSLRLHLDTASAGLTFFWHGGPIRRKESLIDRAMREAERISSSHDPR